MKTLKKFIKDLYLWILDGKYIFIFLILIVGVYFIKDVVDVSGKYSKGYIIQIYGLILQLSGTIIVIKSIGQKMALFKGYGYKKKLKNYLERFPKFNAKQSVTLNVDAMSLSIATATTDIRGKRMPIKDDLQDLIRYIEEEIGYIHKRIAETNIKITKELTDIKNRVQTANQEVENQQKKMTQLIAETSISNDGIDVFGVAIIFIGLIYGTVSDLIYNVISF